jgi:hypothetical protein
MGVALNHGPGESGGSSKSGIVVNQDANGIVTLIIGNRSDMALLYIDPTRPSRLIAGRKVTNDEMAATRSLFDTQVALARGVEDGERREVLKRRRSRLNEMLDSLGRPDIIRALRDVDQLPGVIDRLTPN